MALLGVGRIGTVHYENLRRNPLAQLAYIADVNTARAAELAAAVPGCKPVASFDDVLAAEASHSDASQRLQAVIVCTPTLTHFELVIKALEAGLGVFVEKPLSLDIAQIDRAYALAKERNVPLLTGYQRRFDPNFSAVAEQVKSSDIGDVHVMRSTSRDNPVPSVEFLKTSGGIIHDCGSHDIDLVRWIVGEDPVAVSCMGSCFNKDIAALDDHDTIVISLRFPSGALGTIDLSRHACYGYGTIRGGARSLSLLVALADTPFDVGRPTNRGARHQGNAASRQRSRHHGHSIDALGPLVRSELLLVPAAIPRCLSHRGRALYHGSRVGLH